MELISRTLSKNMKPLVYMPLDLIAEMEDLFFIGSLAKNRAGNYPGTNVFTNVRMRIKSVSPSRDKMASTVVDSKPAQSFWLNNVYLNQKWNNRTIFIKRDNSYCGLMQEQDKDDRFQKWIVNDDMGKFFSGKLIVNNFYQRMILGHDWFNINQLDQFNSEEKDMKNRPKQTSIRSDTSEGGFTVPSKLLNFVMSPYLYMGATMNFLTKPETLALIDRETRAFASCSVGIIFDDFYSYIDLIDLIYRTLLGVSLMKDHYDAGVDSKFNFYIDELLSKVQFFPHQALILGKIFGTYGDKPLYTYTTNPSYWRTDEEIQFEFPSGANDTLNSFKDGILHTRLKKLAEVKETYRKDDCSELLSIPSPGMTDILVHTSTGAAPIPYFSSPKEFRDFAPKLLVAYQNLVGVTDWAFLKIMNLNNVSRTKISDEAIITNGLFLSKPVPVEEIPMRMFFGATDSWKPTNLEPLTIGKKYYDSLKGLFAIKNEQQFCETDTPADGLPEWGPVIDGNNVLHILPKNYASQAFATTSYEDSKLLIDGVGKFVESEEDGVAIRKFVYSKDYSDGKNGDVDLTKKFIFSSSTISSLEAGSLIAREVIAQALAWFSLMFICTKHRQRIQVRYIGPEWAYVIMKNEEWSEPTDTLVAF